MTDIDKLLEPYGMVPVNVETTAKLIAEIDRLRAELASVVHCPSCSRLRAELVRLEWVEKFSKDTAAENDRLRAENAELRAELARYWAADNALIAKTAKEGE